MEGGLFHASTGWEHLLPPGLRQLRDPGVVCREVWDFLALTPMGDKVIRVKSGKIISNIVNDAPVPVEQIEW